MDSPTLLSGLGMVLIALLGYFLRDAHAQVKETRTRMEEIEKDINGQALRMANEFVRKADLKEIELRLDNIGRELFGKMDTLFNLMGSNFKELSSKVDAKFDTLRDRMDAEFKEFDKEIAALKEELIKKLFDLANAKTSQGVKDYYEKYKAYLQGQIGNPEGEEKPNKKYYDPRKWLRSGQETLINRVKAAFDDLNAINRN